MVVAEGGLGGLAMVELARETTMVMQVVTVRGTPWWASTDATETCYGQHSGNHIIHHIHKTWRIKNIIIKGERVSKGMVQGKGRGRGEIMGMGPKSRPWRRKCEAEKKAMKKEKKKRQKQMGNPGCGCRTNIQQIQMHMSVGLTSTSTST